MFDRRNALRLSLASLTVGALAPRLAFAAAPTEKRFVFIIQRGAADGLHSVPPLGDPGYATLRGPLLDGLQGAKRLDDTFALHPALGRVGALFDKQQALIAHAVASAYRDRSHFDGQNVLETGARQAYAEPSGWMNRLIGSLPDAGRKALALAPEVPMALRGPQAVSSYAPSKLPDAQADLVERVRALYADDSQLATLWQRAVDTRAMAGTSAETAGKAGSGAETGRVAAALLTGSAGARLMMIETQGWDTHTGQQARLAAQLRELDALIGALADGLGPAWSDTLVLVATEFGRTAAVNGTGGTDHGTASAALLLGGSVPGGRVMADWPGLTPTALYEGRDLKPTSSLEALICGALARHYALEPARVAAALYPGQPGLVALTI